MARLAWLLLFLASCCSCSRELEAAKQEVARLEQELAGCRRQLTDTSYLGQACSRILGKDTQFRQSVGRLLRALDIMDGGGEAVAVEREVVVKLTKDDARRLRQFVLVDQGCGQEVEDILVRSIHLSDDSWVSGILPGLQQSAGHFQAYWVVLFQVGTR